MAAAPKSITSYFSSDTIVSAQKRLRVSVSEEAPRASNYMTPNRASSVGSDDASGQYVSVTTPAISRTSLEPVKESKIFQDVIYGRIELPGAAIALIDTPQFQRLRYLKQLGLCYRVYPDACHNRFEHSLGVCHLAGKQVEMIRNKGRNLQTHAPHLNVSDRDMLCVQLAGLCHDLGHGPFSHVYDNEFIPRVDPSKIWTHEEGSEMMLDHLLESNQIDLRRYGLVPEVDVPFIKELIRGIKFPSEADQRDAAPNGWPRPRWLYFIVNNSESGLDVDKLDYYQRDCYFSGISMRSVYSNLVDSAEVVECTDNQYRLCFPDKYAEDVYHAFRTRYDLHHKVYQHPAVKAMEYMLVDALVEANDTLRIRGTDGRLVSMSDCTHDPVAFTRLNDSVLDLIWNCPSPKLDAAREILLAMDRRELYHSVGRTQLPPSIESNIKRRGKKEYSKELQRELAEIGRDIIMDPSFEHYRNPPTLILNDADVVVEFMIVHHGLKEKNPVDRVFFYKKKARGSSHFDKASRIRSDEKIPSTLPREFMSRYMRVFCKKPEVRKILSLAFQRWAAEEDGCASPIGGSQSQFETSQPTFENSQTLF